MSNGNSHEKVEKNVGLMAVLIAVAVSFGGLAEIVPLVDGDGTVQPVARTDQIAQHLAVDRRVGEVA